MDDKTDYHWNILNKSNSPYTFPVEPSRTFHLSDNFISPILVSDSLIFCCENLTLHYNKEEKIIKTQYPLIGNMFQTLEIQR